MHGPSDPVVYDPFDLAPGQAAGVVFARYDRGERVDGGEHHLDAKQNFSGGFVLRCPRGRCRLTPRKGSQVGKHHPLEALARQRQVLAQEGAGVCRCYCDVVVEGEADRRAQL